jgi:hypothetical protein
VSEKYESVKNEEWSDEYCMTHPFSIRFTALMPAGDHLNIIDPPGLTVMRIAGGRYRVTAAHRVIWTWMNEFAPLSDHRQSASTSMSPPSKRKEESVNQLVIGDLVSMTIVDVFETDNQGKLLSYCPTFDNRAVYKTHPTTETIRRGGSQLMSIFGKAQNSKTAEIIFRNAKSMANSVREKVDAAVKSNYSSPARTCDPNEALSHDRDHHLRLHVSSSVTSSNYVVDDDTERREV